MFSKVLCGGECCLADVATQEMAMDGNIDKDDWIRIRMMRNPPPPLYWSEVIQSPVCATAGHIQPCVQGRGQVPKLAG